MPLTITLPQLRTALRTLEANISADALFEALQAAPVQTPDKAATLEHYSAMRDEAVASQTCGPLQRVNIESPEFCVTGSRFVQPLGKLQEEFFGVECGALDAPAYIPRGSVHTGAQKGSTVFADCSEQRA